MSENFYVEGSAVRRRRRTAAQDSSQVAMRYLMQLLENKKNRIKTVQALLQCSRSTAVRLQSKSKPFTGRLKLAWVVRICAAAGRPLGKVLRERRPVMFQDAIAGWAGAVSPVDALHRIGDFALAMTQWSIGTYELRGTYTVSFVSEWPREVVFELSKSPELHVYDQQTISHKLVISADTGSDGITRMFVRHIHPLAGVTDKMLMTLRNLRCNLDEIYRLTSQAERKLVKEQVNRA